MSNFQEVEEFKKEFPEGCGVECMIDHRQVKDAKIHYEESGVYICQNIVHGIGCLDKLGYKGSWRVTDWDKRLDLERQGVENCRRVDMPKKTEKLQWSVTFSQEDIMIQEDKIYIGANRYTIEEAKAEFNKFRRAIRKYEQEFKSRND